MERENATNGCNPAAGEPFTIVGAGPAGLACAIVLARAGRAVIVREWHKTVGSRFHGDYQGLENWSDERDILDELRAAGIDVNFERHPVRESTVFDAWGEAYPVRGERPFYYLVRRDGLGGSLVFGLLKQAIAAGAEVRFGDRVRELKGPVVLATGPGSPMRSPPATCSRPTGRTGAGPPSTTRSRRSATPTS
jgi:flavin-dependent dehydrogenase